MRAAHNFKDLTGQTFGRLTVLRRAPNNAWGQSRWTCRCDCGTESIVEGDNLRAGISRSCGCLAREVSTQTGRKTRRHGHARHGARSREWRAWSGMRNRCNNPNHPAFRNYGGRGIKVCDRWESFENFLADVGPKPWPPEWFSLDRIDVNGNYEPGNVRWATWSEQNRNQRRWREESDR